MRKRSEARTAKTTAEKPKTATAFSKDTAIFCSGCDEASTIGECTTRPDGQLECPSCGAAIADVEGAVELAVKKAAAEDAEERTAIQEEGAPKAGMVAGYCGECGGEWHFTGKGDEINKACGHVDAKRVKDPADAKKIAPPAGQRKPDPGDSEKLPRARLASAEGEPPRKTPPENSFAAINEAITKSPTIGVTNNHFEAPRGPRVYVAWGASKFPTVPFASVEIGPFSISEELGPDDDPLEVGHDMIAKLQQIADRAFETQIEWYEKRLKELKGED